MAANPKKFQIMFLGINDQEIVFILDGIVIKSSSSVKLLGVLLDNKLNFSEHVKKLCKSASQKTKALIRIRPFLNLDCAKRLSSAYILLAFNYCPLIWMFGRKSNDGLINQAHKRALRAVYLDFQSPFKALLSKDEGVLIHIQNLQKLMLEIYNSINNVSPKFMSNIFVTKPCNYELRSGTNLILPQTRTKTYGKNSLVFRGSLTWNSLPLSIKTAKSSQIFKCSIRSWDGKNCVRFICR